MSIRVQICDDDPIVRDAIAAYLRPEPDVEVAGCHGDAESALAALDGQAASAQDTTDVLLMDVMLPGIDGIEATRRLAGEHDAPSVLMLTTFGTQETVREAIAAGAAGFLLKASPPDVIVGAVRAAAAGVGAVITPELVLQLADESARAEGDAAPRRPHPASPPLTAREREVLALLCDAESNAGIAQRLVLSESTVKKHVATLMGKLGCTSRLQVAVRAFELGLAEPRRAAQAV